MKISYNFSYSSFATFKRVCFLSILLVGLIFKFANGQSNFKTEINPLIFSISDSLAASENSRNLSAQASFTFKDGFLDEVKSFKMKMDLPATNKLFIAINESLDFELTHVMILPYMNLIHIVGNLELAGVSRVTELDFTYSINEDQTISLIGTKSINLSDYKKDYKVKNSKFKNNNEVSLVLNLSFKNSKPNYIASN